MKKSLLTFVLCSFAFGLGFGLNNIAFSDVQAPKVAYVNVGKLLSASKVLKSAEEKYKGHSFDEPLLREDEQEYTVHSTSLENWQLIQKCGCLKSWIILKAEGVVTEETLSATHLVTLLISATILCSVKMLPESLLSIQSNKAKL